MVMKAINILYRLAFVPFFVAAAVSCSHDELELYNGPKSILFFQQTRTSDIYGNPLSYRNTNDITFASYGPEYTKLTTSFYVHVGGQVTNYDRPYVLKVEADSTDAVEGVDFDLNNNDFIIKAGCARDTVRVTLYRSEKLQDKKYRIGLQLFANENFDLDIAQYKNSSGWSVDGPMIDATRYNVTFSEIYQEPSYWGWYGAANFGTFSAKKILLLNSLMGWTMSDWSNAGMSGTKIQYGRLPFAGQTLQKHLQKMADEGTPVTEKDGSYMLSGSNYPVDYSKYES